MAANIRALAQHSRMRCDASSSFAPDSPAYGGFVPAAVALFAGLWGLVVALAGLNALYLCLSLLGCAFILRDFRIGVVLLILLMPISRSAIFPHAMFGVTGLNPLNVLLVGTLGSCLLRGLFDGGLRRFLPRPLLFLYVLPLLLAGALGARHVGDIADVFLMYNSVEFDSAIGYVRDLVAKPLMLVIFALLVAAAVRRSDSPEKFLLPSLISIWIMGAMVVVYVALSGVGLGQLGSSDSREFLSALGMHANELGRLYASAYALLLFTWAQTKERGSRLALLASMAVVVLALLLTFSRGALVGFAVINLLFLLWQRNLKTLFFFGLAASLALLLMPDAVSHRILYGSGQGLNAISAGRVDGIWLPLLPETLRSPLYGNGLGSILWSDAMHSADGARILAVTHPHNAYLECLLDMGIAGLMLVGAFFYHVWKRFLALGNDPALSAKMRGFYTGAAAGLAGMLISGVSDGSLMPKAEQAFLWLTIGMMYGQHAGSVVAGAGRAS